MWNILTRLLALCALIFLLASRALSAEPTETRIALVVGNAAYQAGPLQTAANDAGLIAQTLQAAAFDVIGARDLDQEGLRRAFRDFLDKASASGPDTVAVIYLSGYALQLEGENYFLPIDAKIARDTDVIAEGVRLSDYLRSLAGLQLKASVIVVDGARKLPFAISGQPLASGLALVEPPAGTLVAFNATPGTVAPEQNGPYGIYAQALAEMMRDAGLPIGEVFDRVRLRVSDVAKGAQLPWSASKLATSFVFFERAPDAPPVVSEQNAPARTRGIAELSPPDAYASAVERDNLNGYEEFLSVYGGDPLAERVRAIVAVRREALTWQSTCLIDTPEAYWSYLRRYPRGPHTGDARRRLALLAVALEPPPSFALVDYDVPPPPPEEFAYIERPIIVFADFGFVPPPPVPDYFLPPPPPDFAVLEAPIVVPEPYVLPVPVFVPLPTWCHVPGYAVHARENIFAEHAHDTFIADRSARSFTIRSHAGEVGAIAPMVTHGASLAASLPPSIRTRAHDPSRSAVGGATHSMTPSARQPLPGMAGRPLPALPGRLGRPSAGSAMAAVPPAGRSAHPQTPPRGIPQTPSAPPVTALPHSLPGTNGHALPQVPPVHQATPRPPSAAGGAAHSMTPSARQPLPGMAGRPLPPLPGRLGRPLVPSEGSAMAAVPPAGRGGHPQTPSRGIPQAPSAPPVTALPHSLPGTNGHALPQVPPAHRATPPAQTNILPQAPRASTPMLANRPPSAAPLVRPPSPPPAVHAPARPPSAALTPSRPPVQSGPPPRPQVHPAPPPPRPAPPVATPPRPMVHAAPPPPRPAPPPAAAPRPQIHAAPPPPRPAPPPAAAVRPAAPPAARPAQPHKRG